MKTIRFLLYFVLIILLNSCESEFDREIQSVNPKTYIDVEKNTRFASSECSGFGGCLPIVSVQHCSSSSSTPGTIVTWVGNADSHNITIKISGVGETITRVAGSSGDHYFNHNKTNYTVDYTAACNSDSKCEKCQRRESFVVINGVVKKTNVGDCGKTYLGYELTPGRYGCSVLRRTGYGPPIGKEKEYMTVTGYSVYTSTYGKPKEYVTGGQVVPGQTELVLPSVSSEHYEIRFYNISSCNSNKHFLYGTYMGPQPSYSYISLTEQKHY